MLAAFPRKQLRENLRIAAGIGVTAYLLVCPFLPPSLIATIRSNQQHAPEDAWSARSLIGLAIVLAASALAGFVLDRARATRPMRFFVLFALVTSSIPLIDSYWNLHWIPQPARYTAEMELAVGMLLSTVLTAVWQRVPRKIAIALAAFLVSIAAEHIAPFVRFTQESTSPVDITRTIEYRIAGWVDTNLPGQRVMVPGSIAQWFNAFTLRHSFRERRSPPPRIGTSRRR
jgi:hypothetical protein